MNQPKISILIPCRNEKNFISNCLNSVIKNDYPKELTEIIVIDGMSDDGTRDIIRGFKNDHTNIKFIDNPDKTVPYALNAGIKASKGEFIIRIDAHSTYPFNYFSKLIEWQQKTNADNIGGSWETIPGTNTLIAKAIALASSSTFGVGNALYRVDYNEVKEVDTVPFGCYKKEVFEKIGLFDEELTRNQDDELNGRLINNGGKIVLVPEIKIHYFARKNLRLMMKMFFQYGFFKPLVNVKLGKAATTRQFAPPLFVIGLILFPVFCLVSDLTCNLSILFLALYFLLNLFFSIQLSLRKGLSMLFFLPMAYFLIHLSYGAGYLNGFIRFALLKKRNTQQTTMSR